METALNASPESIEAFLGLCSAQRAIAHVNAL